MNAIELLKQDHKEVKGMIEELETADKGNNRSSTDLFTKIKDALTLHTKLEETIFYPALENNEETRSLIQEAYKEHKEVDQLLAEMTGVSSTNDEFMDKLTELKDNVEHHVEEEENELFPKAEQVLGQSRLQEMGDQMQQMKQGKSATATTKRK